MLFHTLFKVSFLHGDPPATSIVRPKLGPICDRSKGCPGVPRELQEDQEGCAETAQRGQNAGFYNNNNSSVRSVDAQENRAEAPRMPLVSRRSVFRSKKGPQNGPNGGLEAIQQAVKIGTPLKKKKEQPPILHLPDFEPQGGI